MKTLSELRHERLLEQKQERIHAKRYLFGLLICFIIICIEIYIFGFSAGTFAFAIIVPPFPMLIAIPLAISGSVLLIRSYMNYEELEKFLKGFEK